MTTTEGILTVEFDQTGEFEAWNYALELCRQLGISVGNTSHGDPVGVVYGDAYVAKWRNLTPIERAGLDGMIVGDRRGGPLVLRIRARGDE